MLMALSEKVSKTVNYHPVPIPGRTTAEILRSLDIDKLRSKREFLYISLLLNL